MDATLAFKNSATRQIISNPKAIRKKTSDAISAGTKARFDDKPDLNYLHLN